MKESESCLIISGEKSGEEHALTFWDELTKYAPHLSFYGVGGDDLKKKGVELLYHYHDFSTIGFSSVIAKIPFYFRAMDFILKEVDRRKTRYAILVDYQDFNLRLAQRLKKRGVKVIYYVAPQAWGWRPNRANTLARTVDTLFCLLPFEKNWFRERFVKQTYLVEHPVYSRFKTSLEKISEKKWKPEILKTPKILILPGSRRSELKEHLPILLESLKQIRFLYPEAKIGLVRIKDFPSDFYDVINKHVNYTWEDNELAMALEWSNVCLAASGTVTLTCAAFGVPTIVFYRSSLINEFVVYQLIRYSGDISLPNLILGKRVFPEKLQSQFNPEIMVRELKLMMQEHQYTQTISELAPLRSLLKGELQNVGEFIAGRLK